jgi:hypothetical protein
MPFAHFTIGAASITVARSPNITPATKVGPVTRISNVDPFLSLRVGGNASTKGQFGCAGSIPPAQSIGGHGRTQLQRKTTPRGSQRSDALATTFSAEMATVPVSAECGGRPDGQVISEYDPFDEKAMRGKLRPPRSYARGWAGLRPEFE